MNTKTHQVEYAEAPELLITSPAANWHEASIKSESAFSINVRYWGAEADRYAQRVYGVRVGDLLTMNEAAAAYDAGELPADVITALAQKYDMEELPEDDDDDHDDAI